tara:strand:- start:5435 stop:8674 length:3240 start_codon:yes stop_codon:yes gene_type:complete
MANLKVRTFLTSDLFQYASDVPEFDLIDIVNEVEYTEKNQFISDEGFFVYKSQIIVNDRKASLLGVEGLQFEMFTANPQKYAINDAYSVGKFQIEFEKQDEVITTVAGQNSNNIVKAKKSNASMHRVVSIAQPGYPDAVSTPPTQTKTSTSYKMQSKIAKVNGNDPAAVAASGNFSTVDIASAISLASSNDSSSIHFQKSRTHALRTLRTGKSLRNIRKITKKSRTGKQNSDLARSKDTKTTENTKTNTTVFDLLPIRRLIDRNVLIQKEKIKGSGKIYVRVTPIISEKKGNKARFFIPMHSVILHRKQLMEFLTNPEPPDVMITHTSYASVQFRVTRTDPTLSQVRVVRIIENPLLVRPTVQTVTDMTFGSDDTLEFKDAVDNVKPNKVTYRFVVVNGNGTLGEFTSVRVHNFRKITDPKNSAAVPLSIFAINDENFISVNVTTLTKEVYTVRLLRQELGKYGNFSDTVTEIPTEEGSYEALIAGKRADVRFRDETAVLGRKYRYFAAYRVGFPGMSSLHEEVISDEDEIIIRRFPIESIPFNINVSDPETGIDDTGSPTSRFTIDVTEQAELFNAVIEALRDAGVSSEFIAELQADKVKAKNFVMMIVERYEVASGKRVSFGIIPVGVFVDDNTIRQQKKLPAPLFGEKYRYVFKVCLQDPTVFLQSSTVGINTDIDQEIQKKASRFSRKIYDRLGVLPPEAEVKSGVSIEKLITEAQVGIEFVKTVKFKKDAPKIETLTATDRTYHTTLEWNVFGNVQDVSYYNVYCTINGEQNLLGTVSNSPESGFYTFRDDRYHNAVGEKKYQVTAVSFDDDETISSPVAKSTKYFSLPANMIVGAIFGSFGKKNKVVPIGANPRSHRKLFTPIPPPVPEDPVPLPPGFPGEGNDQAGTVWEGHMPQEPKHPQHDLWKGTDWDQAIPDYESFETPAFGSSPLGPTSQSPKSTVKQLGDGEFWENQEVVDMASKEKEMSQQDPDDLFQQDSAEDPFGYGTGGQGSPPEENSGGEWSLGEFIEKTTGTYTGEGGGQFTDASNQESFSNDTGEGFNSAGGSYDSYSSESAEDSKSSEKEAAMFFYNI